LVPADIIPIPPGEQQQNQGEAQIELPLSTSQIPTEQEILADFDEDDMMNVPSKIITSIFLR
jgi:hypothetical protein